MAKFLDILLSHAVNMDQTVSSLLIDADSPMGRSARIYDPRDFLVPAERINMSDIRFTIPCTLLVLPTMKCITNCCYCYADREGFRGRPEFDLTFFTKLLREMKKCGMETIDISGGDIFCRRDAFDLIECAFEEGMHIDIPTKYPLSKQQIEHLAKLGLSSIQISIDANRPEIIDMLVAKEPGYGMKILKTIDDLGEAGLQVRTNTVLTPYNIHEAPNLARYLAKKPHVFKSNFTCYERSLYWHNDSLFCCVEDISKFENEFNEIKAEFPHKKMNFDGALGNPYSGSQTERPDAFQKRIPCTANRRGFVVLPDGRATICEEIYLHESFILGDLNRQSLMEIWSSPKALQLARPEQGLVPDGPCKDCSDFSHCHEGRGRCVRETLKAYGYTHIGRTRVVRGRRLEIEWDNKSKPSSQVNLY